MIKSYDGDVEKLGNAEQFYHQLLSISSYQTRIEAMLLKVELKINFNDLMPQIEALIKASSCILSNKSINAFLRYTLHMGNFINCVSLFL